MIYETIEELKNAIIEKTKEVRKAQKEYFKYRSPNNLQRSKRLETELDKLLELLDLKHDNYRARQQGNLF